MCTGSLYFVSVFTAVNMILGFFKSICLPLRPSRLVKFFCSCRLKKTCPSLRPLRLCGEMVFDFLCALRVFVVKSLSLLQVSVFLCALCALCGEISFLFLKRFALPLRPLRLCGEIVFDLALRK